MKWHDIKGLFLNILIKKKKAYGEEIDKNNYDDMMMIIEAVEVYTIREKNYATSWDLHHWKITNKIYKCLEILSNQL